MFEDLFQLSSSLTSTCNFYCNCCHKTREFETSVELLKEFGKYLKNLYKPDNLK